MGASHDESGPTTIDGYSQPGAAPNADPLVSNAVITVQIAPAASVTEGTIEGLPITSGGNTIRGVAMYRFRRALMLFGAAADRNVIVGSFIGTDAAGSYAAPAAADSGNGIEIWKSRLPVGSQGGPMTYVSPITGKQYVVVTAGGARQSTDRGDYVMAYALP